MFCTNCGKQLPDSAKFCTNCGTRMETAEPVNYFKPAQKSLADEMPEVKPVPTPEPVAAYAPADIPKAPPKAKRKKFNPLAVIIPAAGAAVIALIVVLILVAFGGDKATVGKALVKSAGEFSDAVVNFETPEIVNDNQEVVGSESLSLWINSLPQAPELEGMGIQINTDINEPGRSSQITVSGTYGAAEIITAQILLEDAYLYADVPQITGGRSFAVNTEQLGAVLMNFGLEEEGIDKLGFNYWDIYQYLKDTLMQDPEAYKLPPEVIAAFVDAIEVEKLGKETVDVNGNALKCTAYEVVIPDDAIADILEAYLDLALEIDPYAAAESILEVYRMIGMPDEMIAQMEEELYYMYEDMNVSDEAYDSIDMVVDTLGNIQLEVFLHKGYVVSVQYEETIDGVDIEFALDLGGGKNYADDLSIEIIADEAEITLVSSGDHTGKNGIYTDSTVLEVTSPYSEKVRIKSNMEYEPEASSDNFSWELDADVFSIELNGQLTPGKKEAVIRFDEATVWVEGQKMASVGMELGVREYQGSSMNTGNSIDLTYITLDELYEEVMAMEGTAMAWAEGLMANYPELAEILSDMM